MPLGPQDSVLSEQLVHLLHIERERFVLWEKQPQRRRWPVWLELGHPLGSGA